MGESQEKTEEVSLHPTLQSRTRSKATKKIGELPPENQEETVVERRTKSPRGGGVSIPQKLSEKVSEESAVAEKDEPSAVRNPDEQETPPLQRRRGGGLRVAKTASNL